LSLSLYILASGSKANAIVLKRNGTALLIDAGLGIRNLLPALQTVSLRPEQLSAVLLTHEHTDHVRGLSKLLERKLLPVYTSRGTLDAVDYMMPARCKAVEMSEDEIEIGDFTVRALPVPHDAAGPVAFHVISGGHYVTVATDLGEVPDDLAEALAHSTCAVLESNHDEQMLLSGSYPDLLKQRIRSRMGHLSNAQTAAALRACKGNGLRTVVLAHLSDENNDPALAHASAADALAGTEVALHVTTRRAIGPFLQLSSEP
jgi:phosphoribosyl 1,2-cyclic phosphodiesterase